MTRLTKNFTLEEMIRSATALKLGINNTPTANAEHNYTWLHLSWQDGRTTKRNQVLHL